LVRAALWLGLSAWTISLLRAPLPALGDSFLHLINLVFHEAGHVVFAPFGSFMMALGWLHLDHTIASIAWFCGAASMIGSQVYSFVLLRSSLPVNQEL
jgi:hypothetical protein